MDPREAADRIEISDVITRYTRAVDTRSWEDLDEVFTDDAVLDYSSVDGPVGPLGEVRDWIATGLAGFDRYQHLLGQVAIEPGPGADAARATAYFTNPMVDEVVWQRGS